MINEYHNDWDDKLDSMLFGYRVATHRSTGYSPFFMLYHRESRLPVEISVTSQSEGNDDESVDDYIMRMVKVCEDLRPRVTQNIETAQKHQKNTKMRNMPHRYRMNLHIY